MSAPFSYSCIQGHTAKVTLPSWDQINILRDPPKSIHTRRIDKVGENNEILNRICGSDGGSRICENIKVYSRGVDPMKNINYNNNGTLGGIRRQGGSINSNAAINSANNSINVNTQAKLPYRIMRDGAFRPPILPPQDLLPLSRLPRIWTYASTNPTFPNFAQKLNSSCDLRQIKPEMLRTCIRPTAIYNIEAPTAEANANATYNINSTIISEPLKTSVSSGIRTMDRSTTENVIPTSKINDKEYYSIQSNIGDNKTYINANGELNPDKYINEKENYTVISNPSSNKVTLLDDKSEMNLPIKERMNYSYTAPIKGTPIYNILNDEIELSRKITAYDVNANISRNDVYVKQTPDEYKELFRNTPITEAYTNIGDIRIDMNSNLTSRDYNLAPRTNRGGFENKGFIPSTKKEEGEIEHFVDEHKLRLQNRINSIHEGRFIN